MQLQPTKYLFLLLSWLMLGPAIKSQAQDIERKIIIDNNKFYYFTIDPELQLATLHTGNKNQNLHDGTTYPVPLGRSNTSPQIPLCFDINKGKLTYINWIVNPSFSRMEALKSLDLEALETYNKQTPDALLQESINIPAIATFSPWQAALRQQKEIDHTFFDLSLNEKGHIEVWISNGSNLTVWEYDGKSWQHSEPFMQQFDQYFTLVAVNKHLLFVNHNMDQLIEYKADRDGIKMFLGQYDMSAAADQQRNLDQQIVVIDKDAKKSWYFPARLLGDKRISLEKLIKSNGVAYNLLKAVDSK